MIKKRKSWNLKNKIIQALRKVWFYSPERAEVIKRCKIEKNKYKCEKCNQIVEKIQVDHIKPVINPKEGFQGWDIYINRLFVSSTKQQGLCKMCHDIKTMIEKNLKKNIDKK